MRRPRLGRPAGRRALATALVAVVVLAGAAAALLLGGGDEPEPTLEASARSGDADRSGTLLDALAGVLATPEPDATPPRGDARKRAADAPPPGAEAVRRAPGEAAAGLFLVGFRGTDATAPFFRRLLVRPFGGVLLAESNYVEPQQLGTLAGEVQVVAANAGHRAPLIAARQEGGEDNALPNLPPRGQVELAGEGIAAIRREAQSAGQQLRALGIGVTFSPVADLAIAGGPAQARAYSDDPRAVARAVRAAVAGYRRGGIAPVVNAFPGEGAAGQDPAAGPAPVSIGIDELRRSHMAPFAAVATGAGAAPAIQMSNAIYLGFDGVTPATLLPDAVRELRDRLGFKGAIVSGDLVEATGTTGGTVGEAAVEALRAGCDLLLVPGGQAEQEQAYRAVVTALRRGELSPGRVAGALRRIAALRAVTRPTRDPATEAPPPGA